MRQAEEAVRARDDFLAVAAHELRSPLNALALRLAALERLAARSNDAALQQGLERAGRSVQRYVARALVLLDVSRLHAGATVPAPTRVRAAALVRDVVDAYADEAAFHGATLRAVAADEDLVGTWDAHMVEQILGNLVGNAIKYGGGTPVEVRVARVAPDSACFEVADRGPGIAPEDRARIFGKFERVVSTSRDRAGFGLGLWIVGRMVAAHGGTIDVSENPGGGALFRVLLPLHAPQPPHRQDENK
nr:HAMP domain-containing sensor histidine kinase [Ramlibacter cellulosilyticus]